MYTSLNITDTIVSRDLLCISNFNAQKGIGFGLTGIGLISLGSAIPDNPEVVIVDAGVLYSIGGVLTLLGIFHTLKAPIHLKRSAAYLEASVTGVRITF